jgi:hypothetical protein
MDRSTQRMVLAAVTACFSMGVAALVPAVVVGRHEIGVADHAHMLTSVHILFLVFAPLCVLGVVASLVGPGLRAAAETHELPLNG